MPLPLTPWLAGGDCRSQEAELAVPMSIQVKLDLDYTWVDSGVTLHVAVSGTHTSDRSDWLQDEDDHTDNHFGLGRGECSPFGEIRIQAKDSETPPSYTPAGFTTCYLGQSDATETRTRTDIPGTVTENGKINLWLDTSTTPGGEVYLRLFAEVNTSNGGLVITDYIAVVAITWAELVSGSPYVIELERPYQDPPYNSTGHITWTFTVT